MYVRRLTRRTYNLSFVLSFVLFVPLRFKKREYVNAFNNVPDIPIYRGNAERAKRPHGYVAEKTNPGASELKKSPSSFDKARLYKGLGILE
jgi:hypothetical protein